MADASLREPTSIDQAIQLINALPKPLELDCFLKNLQPPLQVLGVDSANSAQPSAGPQSPRIFIVKYPLLISVVPAGSSKNFVEFSQVELQNTSVKAEVPFPVTVEVPKNYPYDHLLSGAGTSCRSCHANEYKVLGGYAGQAYASDMIRPKLANNVPVSTLKSFALNCNSATDAYRCAVLRAIFVDGAGQQGIFP